jgi:pimeloyl-ACP methyl ester carboxylesterase
VIALGLAALIAGQTCDYSSLVRVERLIPGPDPSVKLFTMTVRSPRPGSHRAVVLTHGAGSGGSASWDLAEGGVSTMRMLACAGFDVFAFDARGFGGSSMPEALKRPAEGVAPVVRARDASEDLDRVVAHAMKTSSVAAVTLVGWSWGADVAGLYAGLHPKLVERLVLMSPVWDRRWPARHIADKAWYAVTRKEIDAFYAPDREDRAVWNAFVGSLFRFAKGDALRLPSGPYRDLYGSDAPVWDASKIVAPVVVMRGDRDSASLEEHAYRLFEALTHASSRRYVVIGGVGHFLFRERAHAEVERALLEAIAGT